MRFAVGSRLATVVAFWFVAAPLLVLAQEAPPLNLPPDFKGPSTPPPVWASIIDVNVKTDWVRIGVWDTRFETYAVEKQVEVNGKPQTQTMTMMRPVPSVVVHYWPLSALTAATKTAAVEGPEAIQALAGKPALVSNNGPLNPDYTVAVTPETPFLSIPAPSFDMSRAEVALREHLASLNAPMGRIIPDPSPNLAKLFPNYTFFAVQYPPYAADLLPKPLQPFNLAAVSADDKVRLLTSPEQLAAAAKASKTASELAPAAPAEKAFERATNPPQASATPSPADIQYAQQQLQPEIVKLKLGRLFRPLTSPTLNVNFPGVTFFPVVPPPPAPPSAGNSPTPAPAPNPSPANSGRKGFRERDVVAVDSKGKATLITCEQGIRSYINGSQDPSPTDKDKRNTMRLFMALAQGKYAGLTFSDLSKITLTPSGDQTVVTCDCTVLSGGTGKLSVELTFGKGGRIIAVRKPDLPTVNE